MTEIDELIRDFEDRVIVLTLAEHGRNMALKNRDAARIALSAAFEALRQERDGLKAALEQYNDAANWTADPTVIIQKSDGFGRMEDVEIEASTGENNVWIGTNEAGWMVAERVLSELPKPPEVGK
jgi:hypothetical protein